MVHFFKKWKYLDFCLNELESLAQMNGASLANLYHPRNQKKDIDLKKNPCVFVNLPSESVAQKIQSRSVMIKEIINVLAEAKDE